MHFTALDESAELPWEALEDRLGFLNVEAYTHDPARDRDHTIQANWMLYVDNYLEGFHIPYVHPELNQALDYEATPPKRLTAACCKSAKPWKAMSNSTYLKVILMLVKTLQPTTCGCFPT